MTSKNSNFNPLVSQCYDSLNCINSAMEHKSDPKKTKDSLKPVLLEAQRLRTCAGSIVDLLKKKLDTSLEDLNFSGLIDQFKYYELKPYIFALDKYESSFTKLFNDMKFNQAEKEEVYRTCFSVFKEKIENIQEVFNKQCKDLRDGLRIKLQQAQADMFVKKNFTYPEVTMSPDTTNIFDVAPALDQYIVTPKAYVKRAEFEKQLMKVQSFACLDYVAKDQLDSFYNNMGPKELGKVFTFPKSTEFHKTLVTSFGLNDICQREPNFKTVCQGLMIEGKIHGTARVMMHNDTKVDFFMVGTFRKGVLDGECSYIKATEATENCAWYQATFDKGVKTGSDILITF